MKKFTFIPIILILLIGHLFFTTPSDNRALASEIVIIANQDVPENSLSSEELKDIYIGDKTRWSNNINIPIAILRKGPVHNEFLEIYIHLSSKNFVRYWKRKILTGKAEMPVLLNTEQEILDHVEHTTGGIGYISSDFVNDRVKIISIRN